MEIDKIIKELTGKSVISLPSQTELWERWYAGDVKDFHTYEDYNGIKSITSKRRTLNMAKKVCEDWANLLINEKTLISYGSQKETEDLNKLVDKVNFWQKGNLSIEKSFALGNGAYVYGFDSELQPTMQFIQAKKIKPLNIENGEITECAFVNFGTYDIVVQIHMKGFIVNERFIEDVQNGNYCVRTLIYIKKDINTENYELIKDEVFDTGSKKAWFSFIKPNIVNNIDVDSPFGVSIFANAIDVLQGIDLTYDAFCEEVRIGKSRMFINKKLINYDENGERYVFDVNQTGFYFLGENGGTSSGQPLIVYSPTLRTEQMFKGINDSLNLLSSKVGFGENHYRFNQVSLTTATQVISEQNEKFRTKKKHEIIIERVIKEACYCLMYIWNEFCNKKDIGTFNLNEEVKVIFDDSIIEDKATEMSNDRMDVASGVMSKLEYRMKWYGETEEVAKASMSKIEEERQTQTINFFSEE